MNSPKNISTAFPPCHKRTSWHHVSDSLVKTGVSVDEDKAGDHSVMLIEFEKQTGSFKRRVVLGIIVLPLSTIVTCKETSSVIIALHKKCFTGKDIADSKIAPKSTIYRIIKNFKESGSIVVKKTSGRPRKSSKCKDRLLKLIQLRDRATTSTELAQEWQQAGVSASAHTVRRRLLEPHLSRKNIRDWCSGNVFEGFSSFAWQRRTLLLIAIHLITLHNIREYMQIAIIQTEAANFVKINICVILKTFGHDCMCECSICECVGRVQWMCIETVQESQCKNKKGAQYKLSK